MSYLETKRNAIMNAIASGQLTNLLANTTWASGYFDRNDVIRPADSLKQMYEQEHIEVTPYHSYLLINKTSTTQPYWNRYILYNSSKTYNGLETVSNPNDIRQTFQLWKINIGNSAYLRLSLRTFGDIDVALVDMDEVEQWLDSKITYENVTAT